jgi:RNA polymerase sigma factor (sigma-70 family)
VKQSSAAPPPIIDDRLPQTGADSRVETLVGHLFRRKAGEMVSRLTRLLGSERLELAEDVVQEALLRALQQWPYRGLPENPGAWLSTTARNLAIDVLRREKTLRVKLVSVRGHEPADAALWTEPSLDDLIGDDQLTMMFLCSHPRLSPESQAALTLKTVGGFGVSEIARAFLVSEQAIAQRLVRAKRQIREEPLPFVLPPESELGDRLESVLRVLYLLFNEGYAVSEGHDLVREDLCAEAVRLCTLLADHRLGDRPVVHALLALMLFQKSRFDTRIDAQGNLLLMAEQDRSRWDQGLIHSALARLSRAGSGPEITEYHLLAGISACHAVAPSFEDTDWERILSYYDGLMDLAPSAIIALNRAVAVAMRHGPQAGIRALEAIENRASLSRYYLLPATYGELYERIGDLEKAATSYKEALGFMGNEIERLFIKKKLERCQR